ncbi:MAG TPA: rhodanese-like domain-containing protein [Acidimicrobiales bacterium]|nr:rhodanese-like domain-containing protein [Acidimicrobiales bacterium]
MKDLQRAEVQELMETGAQVVEVLPADEYDEDHLPGAVNIPLKRIETDGAEKLERSRPVVLYCWDTA